MPKELGKSLHQANALAAAHYSEHHHCELCEKRPADVVLGLQYQGKQLALSICDPCDQKIKAKGYLEYNGITIMILPEDTLPSMTEMVQRYGKHGARWVNG